MSFVVAVDGPAGSGKGTITKRIEKELGLTNLDTGATYRCVALAALRHGYTVEDEEKIVQLLDSIDIQIENEGAKDIIFLNGEDVTRQIREKAVTQAVSQISSIIPVREKMVILQRKLAQGKNVIVEGRDIGTVVFPNADLKIYLDANEEVRAKRRYKENIEKGIDMSFEEVLENIRLRDHNDKTKKVGALKKADDAIVVDTSNLTIDEAVEQVKKLILEKLSMHGLPENVYCKIKEVIRKFPNYEFKLFGSRAKGNFHKSSDIDIAVLKEVTENDEFAIKNEFDKIDTAYKIDIVIIKENTKKSLVNSIMKEGVEF